MKEIDNMCVLNKSCGYTGTENMLKREMKLAMFSLFLLYLKSNS